MKKKYLKKKEWDKFQSSAILFVKVEKTSVRDKSKEIGNFPPLENITWIWRNPNAILRTGKIP